MKEIRKNNYEILSSLPLDVACRILYYHINRVNTEIDKNRSCTLFTSKITSRYDLILSFKMWGGTHEFERYWNEIANRYRHERKKLLG